MLHHRHFNGFKLSSREIILPSKKSLLGGVLLSKKYKNFWSLNAVLNISDWLSTCEPLFFKTSAATKHFFFYCALTSQCGVTEESIQLGTVDRRIVVHKNYV